MKIHQSTMLDIQDQTLSLLKSSKVLIEKIAKNETVHVDEGLLTPSFLKNALSILENEYQKADELEVVIAVVGTMKAGKSTTINAIVGHEVLPNRNYPMTALPTLVTHVKGKELPTLTFKKHQPILNLSKYIADKIRNLSEEDKTNKDFLHHSEVKSLIDSLGRTGVFELKETYIGQDAIFKFLKDLNDMMRLAKELDIEPPYDEYKLIDDLPVIQVEFQHLSQAEQQGLGKLSILDTPGPNEYGQSEKLKQIFKEQLSKASAVLLVADYTQMNSEAGAAVRAELFPVLDNLGERFYVMLNKFDAKSSNDASKEITVSYFCNQLMDGKVQECNVFPVSASRAFLANRVKVHIEQIGSLNLNDAWVEAFGNIAFGEDWEADIADNDDVIKKASKIWNKSGFGIPIDKVILAANSNAATLSLESALSQLDTINGKISNGVNGLKDSIGTDINKLKEIIQSIEEDRNAIVNIQQKTKDLISAETKKLTGSLDELTENVISDAKTTTKNLFEQASRELCAVNKEKEEKSFKENEDRKRGFLWLLWPDRRSKSGKVKEHFEELIAEGKIKFESHQEAQAQALVTAINDAMKSIQIEAFSAIREKVNKTISDSGEKINKTVNNHLQETIDKACDKLKDSGFSLSMSLNQISTSSQSLKTQGMPTTLHTTKETRTGSREVSGGVKGFFASISNFINDDWGRESYDYDVDIYSFNIDELKKKSAAIMSKAAKNISNVVNEYFANEIIPAINTHITDISDYLEKYRQTLIAGMQTQQKSQQVKEVIVETLCQYSNQLKHIVEDTEDSKEELELALREPE